MSCDFTHVPAGEWRDILIETQTPTTANYQVGPAEFSIALDAATPQGFREVDNDTILGMCMAPQVPVLADILSMFGKPVSGGSNIYFVLKRALAAVPVAAP